MKNKTVHICLNLSYQLHRNNTKHLQTLYQNHVVKHFNRSKTDVQLKITTFSSHEHMSWINEIFMQVFQKNVCWFTKYFLISNGLFYSSADLYLSNQKALCINNRINNRINIRITMINAYISSIHFNQQIRSPVWNATLHKKI